MPTTRKSSGAHAAAAAGGGAKQSKLHFAHRVTKPVSSAHAAKDLVSLSKKSFPAATKKEALDDEPAATLKTKEEVGEEEEQPETAESEPVPQPKPKSESELRAEKVSDAQVNKYWRALEAERMAKRVHQEDLSVSEKVLRYFDVSSQYGPCIGITRMKRWMRAERLGLNPPIEVLAVLLKEEARGTKGIERAHMDEIMNPTCISAA